MNRPLKVAVSLFMMFGLCYAEVSKPLSLFVQRAALMQGVAICKEKLKSPIYDAAQEVRVLQNARDLASKNNLEMESFLIFIQLQMDLSKQIENYYVIQATQTQIDQESPDCLVKYRNSIKKIDEQLYPAISENIESLKSDKNLASQLKELVKKRNIQGIPQDPNYLNLVADSLQKIRRLRDK